MSLAANTLSISEGNSVDLSAYLDNTDNQVASAVPVTPAGGITSNNAQAALQELQTEINAIVPGETNTASNTGSGGVGVFRTKNASDLEFKNINAGSNKISVINDPANGEIDIDVVDANLSISNGQITGLGSAATLDVGTGSFQVVQLDGDGLLPAVGGGNLTNISFSQIDGLGSAATLNTGVDANEIVQLDGSARLPAVDGSQLTNLPSSPWTENAGNVYRTTGRLGVGLTGPVSDVHINAATFSSFQMTNTNTGLTATDGFKVIMNSTGTVALYNYEDNSLSLGTSGTDRLTVDVSGNVGIGTNSPFNKFTVLGQDDVASTQNGILFDIVNNSGILGTLSGIRFKKNGVTTNERFNAGIFYDGNSLFIGTKTNTATNIATTDADVQIDVNGDVTVNNNMDVTGTLSANGGLSATSFQSTGGSFIDNFSNNITPTLVVNRTGTNSAAAMRFQNSSNNFNIGITQNNGFAISGLGSNVGLPGDFFRITNTGDIGVGTVAPSAKLDVVGDVELNGNVITPPSGLFSTNVQNGTIPTPTNKVIRVRNTSTSIIAGFHRIGAGQDGQELIIVVNEPVEQVGTGGGQTLNDANSNKVRFYTEDTVDGVISADPDKLLLNTSWVDLSGGGTLHLIYDSTIGAWLEISRSNNVEVANIF